MLNNFQTPTVDRGAGNELGRKSPPNATLHLTLCLTHGDPQMVFGLKYAGLLCQRRDRNPCITKNKKVHHNRLLKTINPGPLNSRKSKTQFLMVGKAELERKLPTEPTASLMDGILSEMGAPVGPAG